MDYEIKIAEAKSFLNQLKAKMSDIDKEIIDLMFWIEDVKRHLDTEGE